MYINKILVVDSVSNGDSLLKRCFMVDLAEAHENGSITTNLYTVLLPVYIF